ncbi:sulfatase-like hydrolase/transferase [Stieleria marina]|uniref:sulfatase-like hydrolase/transferase n=1 Tax=Stieleria marina TaxID=1930275 RepID=UPI003AF38923
MTGIAFTSSAACVSLYAESNERPNIVVIIADDLGYGETGMMGNQEIPTPGIDQLAKDGLRCLSGYVTAAYCSPSRAGLMTGRIQSRFGYDMNPTGQRNLLPIAGLPLSETTFVQRLSDAGYHTGLVGKWHLGSTPDKHPLARGFDSFYGFLHEGHYYVPGPPFKDVVTMIRDTSLPKGERQRTDDVIRGNYAPISEPDYDGHNPVMRGQQHVVEKEYLTDAISREAAQYIDDHHANPFCLVVSYNAVHSPLQAAKSDLQSLSRIEDEQRRVFAGMLVAMDRGVTEIREAIDRHALTRRTLLVFLSDNGGPTEELTSSNAPLRGGKGTPYEGGIRIPMIWSMPGRIPAGRDETRAVLSLDIAATALDLAGAAKPEQTDGISLLSWINSPSRESVHDRLYWRLGRGKSAFRSGNWKIVRPKKGEPFELYHLASDPGEQRDLSNEYPAKLSEVVNQWAAMDATMKPPLVLPRSQPQSSKSQRERADAKPKTDRQVLPTK